ncbi:hypothetical protein [Desulfitobacterium chlororespirans]|uniref:hypothetical protein n=1 Tax=Desulfitobacterium chlororespirans TaxID=51616 RepID=UPI001160630D|nr:hypothetical protein [Desulfitobacterium chlororespirans]
MKLEKVRQNEKTSNGLLAGFLSITKTWHEKCNVKSSVRQGDEFYFLMAMMTKKIMVRQMNKDTTLDP